MLFCLRWDSHAATLTSSHNSCRERRTIPRASKASCYAASILYLRNRESALQMGKIATVKLGADRVLTPSTKTELQGRQKKR